MAYIIGVPLLAFLAILQSSLLSYFGLLHGRPDLVLLAVVAWSISGRSQEAMFWGLIGGLLLDLLSAAPFASSAIILILIAFLVSLFERRFWEAHLIMPLAVTLIASVIYYLWQIGVLFIMGRDIEFSLFASEVILPSTFLNLLLALPAAQLAKGLKETLFPPEVSI